MNHRADLAAVRSAIEARLVPSGVLMSIGDGDGAVVLRLQPDAAAIAAELKREFADAVEITVGFKPFPPGEPNRATPLPGRLPPAGQQLADLRLTCEVSSTRIRPGQSVTGRVVLANSGRAQAKWLVSADFGWLCRPGTLAVAGGHSGPVTGAARSLQLGPGAAGSLNFIAGTASCQANDLYVVEPGRYEVVVPLSVRAADHVPVRLLARGCFVTVVDAGS